MHTLTHIHTREKEGKRGRREFEREREGWKRRRAQRHVHSADTEKLTVTTVAGVLLGEEVAEMHYAHASGVI